MGKGVYFCFLQRWPPSAQYLAPLKNSKNKTISGFFGLLGFDWFEVFGGPMGAYGDLWGYIGETGMHIDIDFLSIMAVLERK